MILLRWLKRLIGIEVHLPLWPDGAEHTGVTRRHGKGQCPRCGSWNWEEIALEHGTARECNACGWWGYV